MNTNTRNRQKNSTGKLRLILTVTAKDLTDALRNKTIIANVVIMTLMFLLYRAIPLIDQGQTQTTNLLVFDAGNSRLSTELENSVELNFYDYTSEQRMKNVLVSGDLPELGLVIPADFDSQIASGKTPELQGYVVHWVKKQKAIELRDNIQNLITETIGIPVTINIEGNVLYSLPKSDGLPFLSAAILIVVITTIGVIITPHLILEEKHTHTLDVLSLSPLSALDIIIAKTLSGLVICIFSAVVGILIFLPIFTQWWLTILAILLVALFSVSIGLAMGIIFDNRQQLLLWIWVIIAPLLFPIFLSIMSDILPAILIKLIDWLPSVTFMNMLRVSYGSTPAALLPLLPQTFLAIAITALILVFVAFRVNRRES